MNKHRPVHHCDVLEAVAIAGQLTDLTVSIVWYFRSPIWLYQFELQIRSDRHRRSGPISF